MQWTPQQEKFFSAVRETSSSLEVDAVAGSGKSTSLEEAARNITGSHLALAFNVKIKDGLAKRLPRADCKTLNGLGHSALARMIPSRPVPDGYKMGKIVSELLKQHNMSGDRELWIAVTTMCSRAKAHGLVPKGSPGYGKGLLSDDEEVWKTLADHYDIEWDPTVEDFTRAAMATSIQRAFQGDIDFDDQLYIPTCWGASFRKYPTIFVDEAQDLSGIQHEMIKKSLAHGGRVIAVGDPNQAIYGWRGAKADSMQMLSTTFSMSHLPLSVSFRCPIAVVQEAQEIVPHIEWAPGAKQGTVAHLDSFNETIFQHGDVVICRNNGPLIALAYRLISRGVGVVVLGRDIGKGLIQLVNKLAPASMATPAFAAILNEWKDREVEVARANQKFDKINKILDKYESLQAVISFSMARDTEELIKKMTALFSREHGAVTLSTIHKFKGQEAQRVFILDDWLMPSKWAVAAFEFGNDWMLTQEHNLRYVARTRALSELYYINSKEWKDA